MKIILKQSPNFYCVVIISLLQRTKNIILEINNSLYVKTIYAKFIDNFGLVVLHFNLLYRWAKNLKSEITGVRMNSITIIYLFYHKIARKAITKKNSDILLLLN